ncbi:hypothetical protein E8E13_002557 [Curvularia kusanoi]|uniref:Uncharacterized protein n=1 Tax=Curvularia kusanoi TaxID=90978 RepID=A0A9P4T4T8_CURKU|nr:hypothetical protein E8E13_002557 [Curvularia kusanoi]
MPSLILAPYNESMRLGQGYNSFLQTPCMEQAVAFDEIVPGQQDHAEDQSQTVTYSARFVTKISEIVRSMNVSAGSSIKNGSIDISGGGAFSVDEVKFAESDLNVVVSVKVVNETRQTRSGFGFKPLDLKTMNSEIFHEIYGDSFVSGFMEGGELHGIVSIKVLDALKRKEVTAGVRGQLNASSSASPWSLGDANAIGQYLRDTETNVTVNWSGGGFIKPEQDDWDFDGLMRAANTFAQRVAECPRKTWAILSRYDTIPAWQKWSREHEPRIEIRKYDTVQRYTADLLDVHMEYKANLIYINEILSNPNMYIASKRPDACSVTIEALLDEKRQIKQEMDRIVSDIEELQILREKFTDGFASRMEQDLLRRSLPTEYNSDGTQVPSESTATKPSSEKDAPPTPETKPRIAVIPCDAKAATTLNQYEKDFLANSDPSKYESLRFVEPFGSMYNGSAFNDALDIAGGATQAADWPSRIEIDCAKEDGSIVISRIKFMYSNGWSFAHPTAQASPISVASSLYEELKGAKIIRVEIEKRLRWIAMKLSNGKLLSAGVCPHGAEVWTFELPENCNGLKGFWGRAGDKLERLGLVWG